MSRVSIWVASMSLVWLTPAYASEGPSPFLVWGFDRIASMKEGRLHDLVETRALLNVASVSTSMDLAAAVAIAPRESISGDLALVLIDLKRPNARKVFEIPGVIRASLSPDAKQALVTRCLSPGCDLLIVDVDSGKSRVLVQGKIRPQGVSSWAQGGDQVAFESGPAATTIMSLNGNSHREIRGNAPAWRPGGTSIATTIDKEIWLHDLRSSASEVIIKLPFWRSRFVEPLSWSADGSTLFANVPAGLLGYEYACIAIDVRSHQYRTVYQGELTCSAWR